MSQLLTQAAVKTATTGTGTVTLTTTIVPGAQTWASAGAVNGVVYDYLITDGAAWEYGYGTYTSSGTTLSRNLVASSTGSKISLSGFAVVNCIKAHLNFRGALAYKSADQTGANYTSATAIAFDAETYDTDSIHDNVTNNTRLTVPADVTYARLIGQVAINNNAGSWTDLAIWKNATFAFAGFSALRIAGLNGGWNLSIQTPVQPVVGGDYFELLLQVSGDSSIDLLSPRTFFAMEIVQ